MAAYSRRMIPCPPLAPWRELRRDRPLVCGCRSCHLACRSRPGGRPGHRFSIAGCLPHRAGELPRRRPRGGIPQAPGAGRGRGDRDYPAPDAPRRGVRIELAAPADGGHPAPHRGVPDSLPRWRRARQRCLPPVGACAGPSPDPARPRAPAGHRRIRAHARPGLVPAAGVGPARSRGHRPEPRLSRRGATPAMCSATRREASPAAAGTASRCG